MSAIRFDGRSADSNSLVGGFMSAILFGVAYHLAQQAVGAAAIRPHQLGLPSAIHLDGQIDVSNSV